MRPVEDPLPPPPEALSSPWHNQNDLIMVPGKARPTSAARLGAPRIEEIVTGMSSDVNVDRVASTDRHAQNSVVSDAARLTTLLNKGKNHVLRSLADLMQTTGQVLTECHSQALSHVEKEAADLRAENSMLRAKLLTLEANPTSLTTETGVSKPQPPLQPGRLEPSAPDTAAPPLGQSLRLLGQQGEQDLPGALNESQQDNRSECQRTIEDAKYTVVGDAVDTYVDENVSPSNGPHSASEPQKPPSRLSATAPDIGAQNSLQKERGVSLFGAASSYLAQKERAKSVFGTGNMEDDDGGDAGNLTRERLISMVAGNASFELLPVWCKLRASGTTGTQFDKQVSRALDLPEFTRDTSIISEIVKDAWETERVFTIFSKGTWSVHPSSVMRAFWDFSSLVLVLYDIIVIPLESFFEPPASIFKDVIAWVARIFWTFDIGMSFVTGFVKNDGVVELSSKCIRRRYVRSWLVLDLLVVGVDWIETFAVLASDSVGYARLGKVGRVFRIVRMIRLLRLVRMREIVDLITERINSEKLIIVTHISKLMLMIFFMAHLIACFWYGLGFDGDNIKTWVAFYEFNHRPWGDRYAMSLHWAIAQFAGGMDEITPENPTERVYAMVICIGTFIVSAFFISSLTSSMTQLQILGSSQSQLQSVLRSYLHQHKISSKLAIRVQRNAVHTVREQQKYMPEEGVELLGIVSEAIRIELHFEIYSPIFKPHPFFRRYIKECPQVMRKVCHIASRTFHVSAGDVVFSAGEIPAQPRMYSICEGSLHYVSITKHKTDVHKGEWVAEAVLWTNWMHRGDLTASSHANLCYLDAKKFQEIVGQFHHHKYDPKIYANEFIEDLNRAGLEVSDLPLDQEEMLQLWRKTRTASRSEGAPSS